jgi:NTP pyrophosphatase (non-canonical NTP hydrolase)
MSNNLSKNDQVIFEILMITQEECAEVSQAISKVFRFGATSEYNGTTNRTRLEEEVGDLLCMIELMIENGIVDSEAVAKAGVNKKKKLAKWSSIGSTV